MDHPDRREAPFGVARFFRFATPGDIGHNGWANATELGRTGKP